MDLIPQATNLFDELYEEYQNGDPRQVIGYDLFGRPVLLGFNHKF